jgi:hypothetical protein
MHNPTVLVLKALHDLRCGVSRCIINHVAREILIGLRHDRVQAVLQIVLCLKRWDYHGDWEMLRSIHGTHLLNGALSREYLKQ